MEPEREPSRGVENVRHSKGKKRPAGLSGSSRVRAVQIDLRPTSRVRSTHRGVRDHLTSFQAVFEHAPVAMMVIDNAQCFVEGNLAAGGLYGLPAADLPGHCLRDFILPGMEEDLRRAWEMFLSAGALHGEFQIRRADGEIRVVEYQATANFARGRHLAVVYDITTHKHRQEQTQRQLTRLTALRAIDRTITASRDLHRTLEAILVHMRLQLHVDAVAVVRLHPLTGTLAYVVGQGFHFPLPTDQGQWLDVGYAGQVARERRPLWIPDLAAAEDARRLPVAAQEGFQTYYALPLLAKGQLQGVLELFHRGPISFLPDELEFLAALADQAAGAIDHTALFEDLQRSNLELGLAYDTTLEGWSRALDLRDRETEGHTRRVTERTLALARVMGCPSGELVHIRRGALLHDIGKMAIPDSILLKPGPLTADERAIMHRHPVYAYELLSPIAFLRPALDIPYCHHERWDGQGYPRGIAGVEIPRAARIFAVVDVWDALCSDRPYRRAWPEAQVLAHIRELAGINFDPEVVGAFLSTAPRHSYVGGEG